MDTLVVIRKIRIADALAEAGDHDDASAVLNDLLSAPDLTDAHRQLITKKLDLFSKQQQRMTRVMSRREPHSGDTTAELTAMDRTERDRSERPTDVLREHAPQGIDTEIVPKSSDTDHDVPHHERKHRIPTLPIDKAEEVLDQPSEEVLDETPDEETRAPARPRRDTDRPTVHDSTIARAVPRPPRVTDSVVMPRVEDDPPAPGPGKILASDDEYFARREPGPRSDPELKALADDLPEDDIRRELALEVVRLREEMERMKSQGEPATRKLRNPERPTGGSFRIPASQVNTIVRTAAGTDGIDVHIPSRDEDASELRVLRRDSVRGAAAPEPVDERIAIAQDYIDAGTPKPSLLRPLALWLAFAAGVALVGWVVHIVASTMAAKQAEVWLIQEDRAGPYKLGATVTGYPELAVQPNSGPATVTDKTRGWKIEYDAEGAITGITIPGPVNEDAAAADRFKHVRISALGKEITTDWSLDTVRKKLGESDPPYDEKAFRSSSEGTLRYRTGSGWVEFVYSTSAENKPLRIVLRAEPE